MTSPGASTALFRLLAGALLAATLLPACKKEVPPPPAKRAEQPKPAPSVTKDQATAALLALPEVQVWTRDIEQRSRGRAKGAILEDNPALRTINGREYWQLSFVENRKEAVQRRASFLVARSGGEILVEDFENGTVLSLDDWRRSIRRVETKSAE